MRRLAPRRLPLKYGSALSLSLWIALAATSANAAGADAWIDASAPIDPQTAPVYPGNAPIKLEFMLDYAKGDRLALSSYSLGAHTGTHIDAPLHFIKGGTAIDKLPLERLVGPA